MPFPALPSLPLPSSSAAHAAMGAAATAAAAASQQNAWSAGAKDLAPFMIMLNYGMLGNGLTDTWVSTFMLLAAIFSFLNMLQDSRTAPAPDRPTLARSSADALGHELRMLLPPEQRIDAHRRHDCHEA